MLQRAETSEFDQIVTKCRLLDLKSMQNPYVFGAFSGRVGEIGDFEVMSLHVEAPCGKNFTFFIFRIFPMIQK